MRATLTTQKKKIFVLSSNSSVLENLGQFWSRWVGGVWCIRRFRKYSQTKYKHSLAIVYKDLDSPTSFALILLSVLVLILYSLFIQSCVTILGLVNFPFKPVTYMRIHRPIQDSGADIRTVNYERPVSWQYGRLSGLSQSAILIIEDVKLSNIQDSMSWKYNHLYIFLKFEVY